MTPDTITEPTWADDTPEHELLSVHPDAPLIETRVSKVMKAPIGEVYAHFFGSTPELRLDLHKDHVKSYHIHKETETTLEYEYVFEAYGARNWGKAVEVGQFPHRIDVEVTEGPLQGQSIVMLLKEVDGGTHVTQLNRVWPGRNEMLVKMMGGSLKSRLIALAGVHLEQHRADIEGEDRFQDRFSKEHQEKLEASKKRPVADFLATTRAIVLPIIWLPLLSAAAIAGIQGTFQPLALALTLIGGGAALLGANVLNDLWDFRGGADQATRTIPGAIETGSGAFVEGRWSLQKGWTVTAILFALAFMAGVGLAFISTPLVLAYAVAGAIIAYVYIGPPFPLAYKGRGLGELAIFTAFGLVPVLGGVLAHGGTLDSLTWWVASLFGLTASVVLYHHHFLHWMADRAAGKKSPVAVLGPFRGAAVGILLAMAFVVTATVGVQMGALPLWTLVATLPMFIVVRPALRLVWSKDDSPPARQRLAAAGFFAANLAGIALTIVLFNV